MPIDTQSKLLRVLQDQEVRPVGGKVSYKTNCRIVAATNRKTDEAIKDGKLREDLFYRISAISVHLPPLRERREDIMPLANAFLKRFVAQANRPIRRLHSRRQSSDCQALTGPATSASCRTKFSARCCCAKATRLIRAICPSRNVKMEADQALDTNFTLLEGVERNAIVQMLKETGGNKLETAKRLGIGRQTLYNKIKAYGIEV